MSVVSIVVLVLMATVFVNCASFTRVKSRQPSGQSNFAAVAMTAPSHNGIPNCATMNAMLAEIDFALAGPVAAGGKFDVRSLEEMKQHLVRRGCS